MGGVQLAEAVGMRGRAVAARVGEEAVAVGIVRVADGGGGGEDGNGVA